MRFLMLGPLEVRSDAGERLRLGGARQRTLLAALLARPRTTVPLGQLAQDVWGEAQPADPERALRTSVSRLRAALGEGERVVRHGTGYRLELSDGELDVEVFDRLTAEGRDALAVGDAQVAASRLRAALRLWRGEPLADLEGSPLLSWVRPKLAEPWFAAMEDRIEADLAADHRNPEVTSELQGLVEQFPLREGLVALLMRALWACGRQAEALEAFDTARVRLSEELGIDPSPQLRALHTRILRQDEPSPAPTMRAGRHPQHRLPNPLSSFIGRETDRTAADELLDRHRLVTLAGVGGSGKTRLALEVARDRTDRYRDGVWFVPLAPVADPGLVARAIASALELRAREGDEERAVLAHLRDREVLIVLDNCEHLRPGVAPAVERLLTACERVSALATSREPLDAAGEHVWRVPPLRVPPADLEPTIAGLSEYESVRLFVERARAAAPTVALDETDVPAVARICRRLAGIPLAIELAAARVRSLSCRDLADRLEGSIDLLRSPSPTAGERHRTLATTLDWSYGLLGHTEQVVLRRLGVFRTSAPLRGIEALATAGGAVPIGEVVDAVDRLVAASLVEADGDADGRTRYRLLEPVRLYATARLTAEDRPEEVRAAHATWWCDQARAAANSLRYHPGAHREVTAWFPGSVDDLRGALSWALDTDNGNLAQRLVGACWLLWAAYGLLHEGVETARRAVVLPGETTPEVRAEAFSGLALLEAHLGQVDAAREHAEEAAELFGNPSEHAPASGRADTLNVLAHVALWGLPGDHDTAERLATEAVDRGTRHGDAWALGYGLSTLAHTARWRGDLDRAHRILARFLATATDRDDAVGMIMTTYNLAIIDLERARYAEARDHLQASLMHKRRASVDPFGHSATDLRELHALTEACIGEGDLQAAHHYADQGLEAARALEQHDEVQGFTELIERLASQRRAPGPREGSWSERSRPERSRRPGPDG